MKILFAPSEAKNQGGKPKAIDKNCFLFPELFNKRMEAINKYQTYINVASNAQLARLFGVQKQDMIEYYKGCLFGCETMKVIKRYNGVAFEYLGYQQLGRNAQSYIDNNVIIFSNLFGPLLAGDEGIHDYKLKQGERVDNFALEEFYNEHFTGVLNEYLKDEEIIDLRAGFYEKFYKITQPYITMKFTKHNKVVSHWAKAYRGIVLRNMAKNNIQSIEELMKMPIEHLKTVEIKKQKNKTEIVFDIIN